MKHAWLGGVCKGALIGMGAILPGVSGGVLCVALGVYHPLMALLANPLREARRWRFFLPLLMGGVLGVLGLSRVVAWLFRASPVPAVWLFAGLIVGSMPSLWREAGLHGRPWSAWVTGIAAFAVLLTALSLLSRSSVGTVTPTFFAWVLCGALWGLGLTVPGMSPSALFILMGVYEPMAAGIAALSMSVLVPMGLGLLGCVAGMARLIRFLLQHAYAPVLHGVLGLSLASTVMILPSAMDAVGFACAMLGFLVALRLSAVKPAEEKV